MTIKIRAGGLGIPASSVKTRTTDGSSSLVTQALFSNQDTTGAGVTYSVTGPVLLTRAALTGLTSGDTKYSLTCDGAVKCRQLTTAIASTSATILELNNNQTVTAGEGILCETGFDLFVQSVADNSITVSLSYLELE